MPVRIIFALAASRAANPTDNMLNVPSAAPDPAVIGKHCPFGQPQKSSSLEAQNLAPIYFSTATAELRAKALEPMSARVEATASFAITSPAMMTGLGALLRTAAYMSPEQVRGEAVDSVPIYGRSTACSTRCSLARVDQSSIFASDAGLDATMQSRGIRMSTVRWRFVPRRWRNTGLASAALDDLEFARRLRAVPYLFDEPNFPQSPPQLVHPT